MALFAGVELGGTKCVCVLGTGPEDVREKVSIPTAQPEPTLARINETLESWQRVHGTPDALGINCFGPLDLRPASAKFGSITATVKPGWSNTDVLGALSRHRRIPVGFNTDVNGTALAEGRWGAGRQFENFAYVTVGTGVGVGLIVGRRPVFGCNHPELGHLRIARLPGDSWPGHCAFHGDCVEGLASGPAIAARCGIPSHELPAQDPAWQSVEHALAQLVQALFLATAPQCVMIGGGVLEKRPELLAGVRDRFVTSVNGYLDVEDLTGGIDNYIRAPGLRELAGPMGSLALAAEAYDTM